jgi:hypothetical protein
MIMALVLEYVKTLQVLSSPVPHNSSVAVNSCMVVFMTHIWSQSIDEMASVQQKLNACYGMPFSSQLCTYGIESPTDKSVAQWFTQSKEMGSVGESEINRKSMNICRDCDTHQISMCKETKK